MPGTNEIFVGAMAFTTCIAFFFSFFFFIHSVFKYLVNNYYIPGPVLSPRDTKTNKKQSITLKEFTVKDMDT